MTGEQLQALQALVGYSEHLREEFELDKREWMEVVAAFNFVHASGTARLIEMLELCDGETDSPRFDFQ